MHIDELLGKVVVSFEKQENWESKPICVSADWCQGRTVFGGLSAALIYHAIAKSVDDERTLRAMTTNFTGPLLADTPFTIHVNCLRSSKNVSQLTGEIRQNGECCVFVQAFFGIARPSVIAIENGEKLGMSMDSPQQHVPEIDGVTPAFFRHIDLSLVKGGLPFSGSQLSSYQGYMRFKVPPATFSTAHLIALIDSWPPTPLQMLTSPAPASTVSWNLEFPQGLNECSATDWLAYKVNTRHAKEGYAHTEATICDPHENIVALSRQTVTVFA